MNQLIHYEFCKIWLKRRVHIFLAVFLLLNVAFLWYSTRETYETPSPAYYKKLNNILSSMSNEEKYQYIINLDEMNKAIVCMETLSMLENSDEEGRKEYANEYRAENEELLNKYHDTWIAGDYLEYGNTIEQQENIVSNYLSEITQTNAYAEYLADIQSKADTMSGISIFAATANDGFSSANIDKTANDYQKLCDVKLDFMSSRAGIGITENVATDLFLVVLLLIAVSLIIFEEKEKRLLSIIRITAKGRAKSVCAKEIAIFATSFVLVILFELCNVLYYQISIGGIDWGASMQSIAPWISSTLKHSVLGYLILYILCKAIILGLFGSLFLFLAVATNHVIYSYLLGTFIMIASFILYTFIPATSSFNWLKYLNPVGMLNINKYMAGYLNLNFFGKPVHLRLCILVFTTILLVLIGVLNRIVYINKKDMEVKEFILKRFSESIHFTKFHNHNNLFLHELYKVLIMNKAMWIILLFGGIVLYQGANLSYNLSSREIKYKSYMNYLAGELTNEKETFLQKEKQKYEDAFAMIAAIEAKEANGDIDGEQADKLRNSYEYIVAYYDVFQKVWSQYEFVESHTEAEFVYDTGYKLLLGYRDKHLKSFLLELLITMIFCFSAVEAVEYKKGCHHFLFATSKGRGVLRRKKLAVCSVITLSLVIVVTIVRFKLINQYFGLGSFLTSMNSLPMFQVIPGFVPVIVGFIVLFFLGAMVTLIIMRIIVLLSKVTKNMVYTLLISSMLFITPAVIYLF